MVSTSDPNELKQVLAVRVDLKMKPGKMAAQAAHAAIDAYLDATRKDPRRASEWLMRGMPKVAVKVAGERELVKLYQDAKDMGLPCSLIVDAGRTQIEPGSKTCVGIGPAKSEELDRLTGQLPLL
ncbi:MAG: peptidyl-tRNA hydrolase Pth2 [Candidatus Micrarchaeota archaeon]|nr:peptidyl-tRNA hydrolase Pth2 [Candidatus Micrarchaeota archaeon]